ncbi:MAG TPA: PIN domain-containing protein [Solirubrobacterales bacterium]|nr:PIN domain-containing protein [Solirubrobacterales bacterium]
MIAPDTSVLVAGLDPDHPRHAEAVPALVEVKAGGRLVAHTLAETYSVLSSPSGPFRFEPRAVIAYLDQFLEEGGPIKHDPGSYREALGLLEERDLPGAAVYDALIALAARDAGATLLSLDRRAERTYAACGVEARILAGD